MLHALFFCFEGVSLFGRIQATCSKKALARPQICGALRGAVAETQLQTNDFCCYEKADKAQRALKLTFKACVCLKRLQSLNEHWMEHLSHLVLERELLLQMSSPSAIIGLPRVAETKHPGMKVSSTRLFFATASVCLRALGFKSARANCVCTCNMSASLPGMPQHVDNPASSQINLTFQRVTTEVRTWVPNMGLKVNLVTQVRTKIPNLRF